MWSAPIAERSRRNHLTVIKETSMSYSFTLRAANKADAKAAIEAKVTEVVAQQPVHAADQAAILANAQAILDLLPESKEGCEIGVTMNGYVSGTWQGNALEELTQASVSAQIGWVSK